MCLSTACRAVAATDFAVDHGGAEGLFRAPVGRIDGGVAEKAKEGRQFDTQMRGKAVHRGERADVVERRQDPTDQVAACDRDAVVGDGPGGAPVAEAQRLLQRRLDTRGKPRARMVVSQVVRAAEQVRETRLMPGSGEPASLSRRAPRSRVRDRTIGRVQVLGRRRWRKAAGYHRQARVENAVFRYKSIIGPALRARTAEGRQTEARLACNVLNRMAELGRPASRSIGR